MANSVLHDFLQVGLLDIATDDDKFQLLQKTSQDIAKRLPKKKIEIVSHTLVALDPQIPSDNPVLIDVEENLVKHWSTFRNRFRDTPRQMLRPLIFEALREAAAVDPGCAAILWLTGGNYVSQARLGKEEAVTTDFLKQMGAIAEAKAIDEWAQSLDVESKALPPISLKVNGKVVVDEAKLRSHLAAAAGPSNAQGQPSGDEPNPHWPNQNANWVTSFAQRGAKGLAEVISETVNTLPSLINKGLNAELSEVLAALNATVEGTVTQLLKSAVADQRRNRLLWWRETLYSPTLQRGYRQLDAPLAAFMMAYDLHTEVPAHSPQSVEFLLREAVRAKQSADPKPDTVEIEKLIGKIAQYEDIKSLKKEIGHASNIAGRKPLLGCIQAAVSGEAQTGKQLTASLGFKNDTPFSLEDFAVWVYRDLQSQRLATTK